MRKLLIGLFVVAVVGGLAPASDAATPQIVDPALDHPVPFEDIVSVELKVVVQKGRDYLQTTFTMSGEVSDASRNAMTGYDFSAKVGTCDLIIVWYAYPMVTEPAGLPTGSVGTHCGATGKDVGGSFKFGGNTVTITSPMQDLKSKGVVRGAKMTKLEAHTAPLEGLAGDDEGALALLGDSSGSDKAWTVG